MTSMVFVRGINDKLKWKNNVNYLVSKINRYRTIIFLVRNSLTREALKTIYPSLVYSGLLYGNVIWGNCSASVIKPLITAQKKLIRTMMFRNRLAHTNDDFYALKLLKVDDINFYCSCLFTFKSLSNLSEPSNYFNYSM